MSYAQTSLITGAKTRERLASDGREVRAQGTRDGAQYVADWKQGLVFEGRVFVANVGSFSTPIVGGGNGTILDLDQPEFILSIPSGTSVIPLRVAIQTQTPLLATDADESEILLAVDTGFAAVADGTKTTPTIYGLRTDKPVIPQCVFTSAYTADVTDPVITVELARSVVVGDVQGTPATALWTKNELVYEPAQSPVIVGPAMLIGYWGGTVATPGFAEVVWAELPTAAAFN